MANISTALGAAGRRVERHGRSVVAGHRLDRLGRIGLATKGVV